MRVARPASCLLLAIALVGAQPASAADAVSPETRALGRAAYDAVVLRPLGVVQTVVGAAFFPLFYALALPFAAGDEVVEICLEQPIERTFRRSLGDF